MIELPPEVTGPPAWYGPEMAKKADWIEHLSAAEIGEIETAVDALSTREPIPSKFDRRTFRCRRSGHAFSKSWRKSSTAAVLS